MEKQKLLFHQARLANRGVAEMVLLHISACKGIPSEMVMKTLQLGIAVLRGGNLDIQMVIVIGILYYGWWSKLLILDFIFKSSILQSFFWNIFFYILGNHNLKSLYRFDKNLLWLPYWAWQYWYMFTFSWFWLT